MSQCGLCEKQVLVPRMKGTNLRYLHAGYTEERDWTTNDDQR